MSTLKGKSAIVTGSTSGIGLGIAKALAGQGVNIMLNGFGDAGEIENIRKEITAMGVGAVYSAANMEKPDEIRAMAADAAKAFGRVDILVPNAGVQFVSPIEDFPEEKFESIIRIDLMSGWYASKAVFKGMKDAKWGRIVSIVSAHGLVASPFKSAYVSAKHGMLGMMKTLALEGATFGVTANAICPGYVHTPLVDKQIPDTMKARNMTRDQVINDVILAAQPTKQFVTVEQVASLVLYLCSDNAAQINGAALSIDGGWTAQ
ncbi:MAG: 3-hydroxybutyrate dehydrogenase [Alphaproteobacteria bacterium]|nr:3-hydroxybutyrate dehydrogenase [Alphaproteobacteria bacterium]